MWRDFRFWNDFDLIEFVRFSFYSNLNILDQKNFNFQIRGNNGAIIIIIIIKTNRMNSVKSYACIIST